MMTIMMMMVLYIDYVQTQTRFFYTNIFIERLLYAKPQTLHLQVCSLINSSPQERTIETSP